MIFDYISKKIFSNLNFEYQVVKELQRAWSEFSVDEHVPLHEYMMALAIKMISKTQLGAFFKNDENVRTFHKHYMKVEIFILVLYRRTHLY